VQSLLPPGSGSLVLVTSRRRLEGLVVSNSARIRRLGVLDEDSARWLETEGDIEDR
jgi:hypothetical protein